MKSLCIRDQCVDGVAHELVFEMACEYGEQLLCYAPARDMLFKPFLPCSCPSGIQRTHRLAYQECVALSAVFDDHGASQLSVDIAVFKQLLEQVDHR